MMARMRLPGELENEDSPTDTRPAEVYGKLFSFTLSLSLSLYVFPPPRPPMALQHSGGGERSWEKGKMSNTLSSWHLLSAPLLWRENPNGEKKTGVSCMQITVVRLPQHRRADQDSSSHVCVFVCVCVCQNIPGFISRRPPPLLSTML